jgi:hypothetical protein
MPTIPDKWMRTSFCPSRSFSSLSDMLAAFSFRQTPRFATRVIEIERGKVRVFEGGFSEYRQSRDLLDRQAWEAYAAF